MHTHISYIHTYIHTYIHIQLEIAKSQAHTTIAELEKHVQDYKEQTTCLQQEIQVRHMCCACMCTYKYDWFNAQSVASGKPDAS